MSLFQRMARRASDIVEYRLFRQQWNCAIVKQPIAVVAGLEGGAAQAEALATAVWMPEPPGGFVADPFGMPLGDDRFRILVEHYDWQRKIGVIATCVFDGKGYGELTPLLDAGTHLSYPFILRHDGRTMFVPEHSEARDVSAYDISGEGVIGRKRTLIGGRALIDSTIIPHGGRYWLFATEDTATTNAELNIFVADDLFGPWRAHAHNPVKMDRGSARPAGTPFTHAGHLYRPSQDCERRYGSAVVINRVVDLTETTFVEEPVARVSLPASHRYDDGLHTLASLGDYTLIDAARKAPVFWPG